MSIYKIPLPLNILEAARERITWTLNTLPRVCVSFSGGKDSGLMLHL
ncbi:phosphoadenosine phosphosulfate reductase, partial [Escherichia coli]|nr:phosphoadenosine phosphosulfate reductase [Escherichia coli]